MNKIYKNIKIFNFKLFIALCLLALIPTIYKVIRTFFISNNISISAFDVIGQMEWFDLINETLVAFLIVPLYSILNKIFKNSQNLFSIYVFKTMIIVIFLYSIFQLVVFCYGNHLVTFMNQNDIDIGIVNRYLRLETIAFVIGIIYNFSNVVFIVTNRHRSMYILLVVNALLMIVSDFFLIPSFGINGVAYSNILINGVLGIICIVILIIYKNIKFSWFQIDDLTTYKIWLKTGLFSGFQSFVDNIVYALMVAKMVNMVSEQGNYWIANNFIWGWLLIPIISLGEVIKRDCKDGYNKLKKSNYYIITIFTIIVWLISIPLWKPFYRFVQGLENAEVIYQITIKLAPFYIFYAIYNIIDNIFIGVGKTKYNAINSLIINILYYGIFFILFKTNFINMTINTIIIMFGFGMVVHLVISLIEEKHLKQSCLKVGDV